MCVCVCVCVFGSSRFSLEPAHSRFGPLRCASGAAMGCNILAKGSSGKGANKGRAGKGSGKGKGMGSGKGSTAGKPGGMNVDKISKKLEQMEDALSRLLKGSTPKVPKEVWTCLACGDEKCFVTRKECHRCKAPRGAVSCGGQPTVGKPKAGGLKQEVLMEVEADASTTEDRIAELEDLVKAVKGKETPLAKAQRQVWEEQLKQLKEEQRQARPLPARLQAATDRLAKVRQSQEELGNKAAQQQEQLEATQRELAEVSVKVKEAELELEAVKRLAAEGSVESTVKALTESMAAVLATHVDAAVVQAMIGQVMKAFSEASVASLGPGLVKGPARTAQVSEGQVLDPVAGLGQVPPGGLVKEEGKVEIARERSRSPRDARSSEVVAWVALLKS